jgi:Spy/CpxP family protein refolding chaperone
MHSILAVALLLFQALSPADVQGLLEGSGMGLAKAAELNSYPGPKHVLEMADSLKLTAEQRATVQKSHDEMKAAAMKLGREIVDLERQLNDAFASTTVDAKRLGELTTAIAERQGKLRYVHLAAHLRTRAALTPQQIQAYDVARGYASDKPAAHTGHH